MRKGADAAKRIAAKRIDEFGGADQAEEGEGG